MESDDIYAKLLDQVREEVRAEVEDKVREETVRTILQYFAEDEGWGDPDGSRDYRNDVMEQIRDAFARDYWTLTESE